MKKYELTDETLKSSTGKIVYRIRALKDFGHIRAGALGGWVESEKNLDQGGQCWVHERGFVSGDARVSENVWVRDNNYNKKQSNPSR